MSPPSRLIGVAFSATESGFTPGELRSKVFQRPFPGVRSLGLDLGVLEHRCRAYAARLPPGGTFSYITAARLWGMPLSLRLVKDQRMHVTVPAGRRAPRVAGIVGHSRERIQFETRHGVPVTAAAATWCDLATLLPLHDLVAVGDYILTGDPYRDVLPLGTLEDLKHASAMLGGQAGHRRRIAALALIVDGPLSRPESLTRLLLAWAGLPHPEVEYTVHDERGSFLAMPDLAWPQYRVALEYEGDDHRSVARFRSDIRRIERLVDHGWLVVKVSADDLFDRPGEVIERVRRRFESRGCPVGPISLPKNVQFER